MIYKHRGLLWGLALMAMAGATGCVDGDAPVPCTSEVQCAAGQLCSAGVCANCSGDVECQAVLGSQYSCNAEKRCVAGCVEGDVGCACSADERCNDATCVDGTCAECVDGAVDCPCFGNGTCSGTAQCTSGVCAPCVAGTQGCPCGAGDTCDEGRCLDGVCAACVDGDIGCSCGADETCSQGWCVAGQCETCQAGILGCTCTAEGGCDGALCVDGRCAPCVDGELGCGCGEDDLCSEGYCAPNGTCSSCVPGALSCPCDADGECAGATNCVADVCTDCVLGEAGCTCYGNGSCKPGLQCGTDNLCATCPAGEALCPCGFNDLCGSGLECVGEICVSDACAAGELQCPCGADDSCGDGAVCNGGLCVVCAPDLAGCPCKDDATCNAGLVCDATATLCRDAKACGELCAQYQLCESEPNADPTCIEECEEGWDWNADTDSCDAVVPLTCDGDEPGSILAQCQAVLRKCVASDGTASCGECYAGYLDEGGICRAVVACSALDCAASNQVCMAAGIDTDAFCAGCLTGFAPDGAGDCVPLKTCTELDCGAANKTCTAATATVSASCGVCLDFFVDDGAANCVAVDTCTSLDCAGQNRNCTAATATTHALCTECLDFFTDSGAGCTPVLTCSDLTCDTQNRECTAETETSDAACADCKMLFVEVAGVCQSIPATCVDGDPGDITAQCAAEFRECEDPVDSDAACGGCLTGYADNGGTCQEVTDCVTLACGLKNRVCEGTAPFETCGDCLDGTLVDAGNPEFCIAPQTCSELDCEADEFCVEGDGVTTTASCVGSTCTSTQAYSDFTGGCVECTVTCGDGPGETGRIWLYTLAGSSSCICETEPGYYWDEGGVREASPCDEDGDGWVQANARDYIESTDEQLVVNARCDLLIVDRVVLQNELGQRLEVRLCDDTTTLFAREGQPDCSASLLVPLYETERNDSNEQLLASGSAPALTSAGAGRKLVASEVNRLTRACTQGGDYNDNGVTDVREWHGMTTTGGGAFAAEVNVFNQFSHYVELSSSSYEAGTATVGVGNLVIREKSRCDSDFPFQYITPGTNDYWRECTRSRDVAYDPSDGSASPEFGLDYALWSCDALTGSCPVPPPPTDEAPAGEIPEHRLCEVPTPLLDEECDDDGVAGGWTCVDGAVWRGMNHSSQFRCVIVDDTASIVEPRLPTSDFGAKFDLNECGVACPNGDDQCASDCTTDGECTTSSTEPAVGPNPSAPDIACAAKAVPVQGDVGWALSRFDDSAGGYVRGCINEWAPDSLTTGPLNGSEDVIIRGWRELCPGFTSSPNSVIGQGQDIEFGQLQCGCGDNYGGASCDIGCPDLDVLLSPGYVSSPRSGLWMCGRTNASGFEASSPFFGPAHWGADSTASVWTVRGAVASQPISGTLATAATNSVGGDAGRGTSTIYGFSDPDCVEALDFDTALTTCESNGGRLCTRDELENLETANTGCGFDDNMTWSSTECGTDAYWVAVGNAADFPTDAECRTKTSTASARCCEDAEWVLK